MRSLSVCAKLKRNPRAVGSSTCAGNVGSRIFGYFGSRIFGYVRSRAAARSAAASRTVRKSVGGAGKVSGNALTKNHPSKFGIVYEYVSVALNAFNNVVALHLPGINRVKRAPFKKHLNALKHLGNIVSAPSRAPSYVNVETDSRYVTLNAVKRLEIIAV